MIVRKQREYYKYGVFTLSSTSLTNKLNSNVVRDKSERNGRRKRKKLVVKEDVGFEEIKFTSLAILLIMYISPTFLFSLK